MKKGETGQSVVEFAMIMPLLVEAAPDVVLRAMERDLKTDNSQLVELMRQDPANVERGTRIIIASHYLERIGDRATNSAEDVVYLVTGDVEDLNP